jgi:anaerobic magnesium-protoporphyrin IX monomethyl ester cyclase
MKDLKLMILNLPSPPHYDVSRDLAGGFGTASYCPRRDDYGQSEAPILQPCLPFASAVLLKAGYDLKVLDCQRLKMTKNEVVKEVGRQNPDIIFCLIGLPSLKKDAELMSTVKKTVAGSFLVGMGTACKAVSREILFSGCVDTVLRTDYPYVSNLVDVVEAFRREKDLKRVSGISYLSDEKILIGTPDSPEFDFSTIPPPCYDLLRVEGYHSFMGLDGTRYKSIPILGSKGCPYGCIYCPYPFGFGSKWTRRLPREIVDEMEYLHEVHGIHGFQFRDQSFTMNKRHALEVCDEIIRRRLDVVWLCEARVNESSRSMLTRMKEAGCIRIHYGVETGDPDIISSIGKPGVDLPAIRKVFRLTKEIGFWRSAHMIIGWPDESQETLERTYRFVRDLDPDDENWNFLTPYPGTKLFETGAENSWILTRNWSEYTTENVIMSTTSLTSAQLNAARRKFIRDSLREKTKKTFLQIARGKMKPTLRLKDVKNIVKYYVTQSRT